MQKKLGKSQKKICEKLMKRTASYARKDSFLSGLSLGIGDSCSLLWFCLVTDSYFFFNHINLAALTTEAMFSLFRKVLHLDQASVNTQGR